MKEALIQFLRRRKFQGFWEKMHHISKIGMNYWGGASLYHSGELHTMRYVRDKLKGKSQVVVFDVGANSGHYALAAREIFGKKMKLFAFEPSKHTYEILKRETAAFEEISCFNFGFGEKNEIIKLYSSGPSSSLASVHQLTNTSKEFKPEFTEEIKIETINGFCENHEIREIDFLKIDIEGHEFYALKGASNMIKEKRIKFIQFEFGECHMDSGTFFRDIYNLFEDQYHFYRIVTDGPRAISRYSTDLEVFNTANYLVELKT